MIVDRNIRWNRAMWWLPVNRFTGLQALTTLKGGAAGTAVGYDADAANFKLTKAAATDRLSVNVVQQGAPTLAADPGTRVLRTLTGTEFVAMLMTTAADEISTMEVIPSDLDINQTVGVRVVWTCEAAAVGARTITWRVRYLPITLNTTAFGATATALDTVIAAQAPAGTTLTSQITSRGICNVGSLLNTHQMIQWRVDMSAFNAALTENKWLVGLLIDYVPRRTLNPSATDYSRVSVDPGVLANFLGNS